MNSADLEIRVVSKQNFLASSEIPSCVMYQNLSCLKTCSVDRNGPCEAIAGY